jgi:hypothetical protein
MKLTIIFKDEFEEHMKKQFESFTNPQVYYIKSIRIKGRYLYATISSTMCWSMDDIAEFTVSERRADNG